MSDFVLALTTLPGDFDATALAQDLVGAGLAACVNILPAIKSVYTWEGVPAGRLRSSNSIIKTTTAQVDALWDVSASRHPYDVPEFLVVPVIDGSEDYLRWLDENVGPRAES